MYISTRSTAAEERIVRVCTKRDRSRRNDSGHYGLARSTQTARVGDDWRMLIRESGALLKVMLAAAGENLGAVGASDPPAIWQVFERFARIPVDDARPADEDGDGLLAQFGTFDFRGPQEFSTDLTRQFIERDDDDGAMWQLSCTLFWDPTPDTAALGRGELWSFEFATADTFFARASALPGWSWALAGSRPPRAAEVALDRV